jgi:negative regulator of genetic competence, sporulation and motility
MNIENTISYVFVILTIILVIPLLPYVISVTSTVKQKDAGANGEDGEDSNKHLIEAYGTVSEDLIIYNTLNELYLLCSYIPFRRVKICTADTNEEDVIHYNKHLKEVFDTLALVQRNLGAAKTAIAKLKKEAFDTILVNKAAREKREHEEYLAKMTEYGANSRHSSDNFRQWFVIIIDNMASFFKAVSQAIAFVVNVLVQILNMIMPAIAALLRNPVFVGFLILVGLIFYILGLIKDSLDKKRNANKQPDSSRESGGSGDRKQEKSFTSIFQDIIDIFNYFKNMLMNFKVSGLFGSVEAENEDVGSIDRDKIEGGSYDNLSYIMLSEIFNGDEIKTYFGKNVSIAQGKYYNVLLPEGRFKDPEMSKIKWKVIDRIENKDEKVWRIDCEQLDAFVKKDGTTMPAFVGEDTCVINQKELKAYDESMKPKEKVAKRSTEYIKSGGD